MANYLEIPVAKNFGKFLMFRSAADNWGKFWERYEILRLVAEILRQKTLSPLQLTHSFLRGSFLPPK